jgi:hypothetical protein
MIEHLRVARTCNFYKLKKRLTAKALTDLFRDLRDSARNSKLPIFRVIRSRSGQTQYSAICFSFERRPQFLSEDADEWDRIFGFLMIIEKGDLIAVLKSGLDLPSSFRAEFLDRVGSESVEAAIAQRSAVFEKLRLRNMSTSRLALRTKSLEARNLENTVATSSASRFVPLGYSVVRNDGRYSVTPNTGRISNQSTRSTADSLATWAGGMIDALNIENGEIAPFIQSFAREVHLTELPKTVHPSLLAFEVDALRDALYGETPQIRLLRKRGKDEVELTKDEGEQILTSLDQQFNLRVDGERFGIFGEEGTDEVGTLRVGKTRITANVNSMELIQGIFVDDLRGDAGQDEHSPLARFLNAEHLFTVLFSDLSLAYIEGSLFRDNALLAGGETFLKHLITSPELRRATSEKGTFVEGQRKFSARSVFRILIDHIAADSDILVCDDLGTEWADFIGASTSPSASSVSFYHAKHGELSLGASAFHVSVSQAIKNLGYMVLESAQMRRKCDSWEGQYLLDGIQTAIRYILRGGTADSILEQIGAMRTAPNLSKNVYIVTSSLSKTQVATAFADIANGRRPRAHFVQLYWLLTSFFSACSEVGVIGYVVCQP